MRPSLALTFSTEAVVLYSYIDETWHRLGRVSIAAQNLAMQMAVLRRIAQSFGDNGSFDTLLVVPDDQVLWRRFDSDGVPGSPAAIRRHIEGQLVGLTPYEVEDLRFDWRRSGSGIDVAVIAVETMREVEAFALTHGFHPVGLAAISEAATFDGTAWFGLVDAPPKCDGQVVIDAPTEQDAALFVEVPDGPDLPPKVAPAPVADREKAVRAKRRAAVRRRNGRRLAVALSAGLCALVAAAALFLPQSQVNQIEEAEWQRSAYPSVAATVEDEHQEFWAEVMAVPEASPDEIAPEPEAIVSETQASGIGAGDIALWSPQLLPTSLGSKDTLDMLVQPAVDIVTPLDAVVLHEVMVDTAALQPQQIVALPQKGIAVQVDTEGFVVPSAQGNDAPGGYLVRDGKPDAMPAQRPAPDPDAPEITQVADANTVAISTRPKARPSDLIETYERLRYGGRSLAELAVLRPLARDPGLAAIAYAAFNAGKPEVKLASFETARPAQRPSDLNKRMAALSLAKSQATAVAAASTAAVLFQPAPVSPTKIPDSVPQVSPRNVSSEATANRGLNLRDLNLLGTFGKPGDLRALVRMPNGNVLNVSVGDRLDGGRVIAIAQGELRYTKSGRNQVLTMPKG